MWLFPDEKATQRACHRVHPFCFCRRRWLRGYSHRHYGEAESGGKRRGAENTDPVHGRKYGRLRGSRHQPAQEIQPSALALGRISGVSPEGWRVEFSRISRYSDHADAFVRQVVTVCAPAGGEMSGLIAHFLFGANCQEAHIAALGY